MVDVIFRAELAAVVVAPGKDSVSAIYNINIAATHINQRDLVEREGCLNLWSLMSCFEKWCVLLKKVSEARPLLILLDVPIGRTRAQWPAPIKQLVIIIYYQILAMISNKFAHIKPL